MADALIAKEFAGYRIDSRVGRGGMGVVYRATDLSLDRTVALKVLDDELAKDPDFRRRFVTESKLAASLDHPTSSRSTRRASATACPTSRCASSAARTARGPADRGPARARPRRARWSPSSRPRWTPRTRPASCTATSSPANVLLAKGDHVYLTDFGLTKRVAADAEATKTGVVLGTLNYMAPEQIRGQAIGPFTDVYSLGCMIVHLLTGAVPFPVEADEAKLWAHVAEPPPRPSERVEGLGDAFDPVVARAMGKRPEDRFATAGEVGAAMTRGGRRTRPRPRAAAGARAVARAGRRRAPRAVPAGPRARLRPRAVQPRGARGAARRRDRARPRRAGHPARARCLRRGGPAQLQGPRDRAPARAAGVSPVADLHESTPSELKARLEVERRGVSFLHYRDADGSQRIVELEPAGGPITVGRRADNAVPLGWDAEVSRVHAQLEPVGRDWVLVDDGLSRNGTFVNGERAAGRRRLRDGDRICFGETIVRFRAPLADESRSTAAVVAGSAQLTLTETQRRVLVALCRPLEDSPYATPATNREIAEEIHLSVDAVKAHLRVLFERLGIDGLPQNQKRARLAAVALVDGLVRRHDF